MTPEEIITCPYNKAHSIISNRMQFHLTRCRAQYPYAEKTTCPFNSTHIINKIELEIHQMMCEDRIVLDSFSVKIGQSRKPLLKSKTEEQIEFEESWDDELMDESVLENVKMDSLSKPSLTVLIGAPKSERKAHRFNERLRIQEVLYKKELETKQKKRNEDNVKRKGNEIQNEPKTMKGNECYSASTSVCNGSNIDKKQKEDDVERKRNEVHNEPKTMKGNESTSVCYISNTEMENASFKNELNQFTGRASPSQNANFECDNFVKVVRKGKSKNSKQKASTDTVEIKATVLQLPASSSEQKKKEISQPVKTVFKNNNNNCETKSTPKCLPVKETKGLFSSPWKMPIAKVKPSSHICNVEDFPLLPTAGYGRGKIV